jgi:CheY-like chemotaxis protein
MGVSGASDIAIDRGWQPSLDQGDFGMKRVAARRVPPLEHSTLTGYSILLVEPNPHLASDLGRALDGAGAEVFIALTSIQALPLAECAELSGAVLDYTQSLRDGHRVATRLSELCIPFLFCKDSGRNEPWPHAPLLHKPIRSAQLIALLRRLLDPEKASATEHSKPATGAPERAKAWAVRSLS